MSGISSEGPGAVRVRPGTIELNGDRGLEERLVLVVTNIGDRPVQIGSHVHLADVNDALALDREAARGFRLDIPAGSATRFEPGQARTVRLIPFGGARIVHGFNAKVAGPLD